MRNPKDLYLLSLAETVGVNYLVSGDADLLVLGKHKPTRMVRFIDFRSIV